MFKIRWISSKYSSILRRLIWIFTVYSGLSVNIINAQQVWEKNHQTLRNIFLLYPEKKGLGILCKLSPCMIY